MSLALAVLHARPGGTPPEREGRPRDSVRLMIADRSGITHSTFDRIGEALIPGDVLVVNVSATIPAAVEGHTSGGEAVRLHLSCPITTRLWTVEPRRPSGVGSTAWRDFEGGMVELPGGVRADLLAPDPRSPRLWITSFEGLTDHLDYLYCYGQPIRYSHTGEAWPLEDYQTVYAVEPGSAEMPSAGRPFTTDLITSLVANGVIVVPVVLHSGVASFEEGERPDIERYRIPATTARIVNEARMAGGRIIAVGTTSARALETVANKEGVVSEGEGVTDLIVTAERGVRVIDGLITGWHDAGASHIELVTAVGGREIVEAAYAEAARCGYVWHEFGDSLFVLRSAV